MRVNYERFAHWTDEISTLKAACHLTHFFLTKLKRDIDVDKVPAFRNESKFEVSAGIILYRDRIEILHRGPINRTPGLVIFQCDVYDVQPCCP